MSEAHQEHDFSQLWGGPQILDLAMQVFRALDGFGGNLASEDELKPVEKMMSEAYQEIDKAVVKGIIKQNTAARRKSRLAIAKQKLLIAAGLYARPPTTESA